LPDADICFVATSKSGLGHLRRVVTIAQALNALAPQRRLHLVSNALPLGIPENELSVFAGIRIADRAVMAGAAAKTGAGILVLDTITVPGVEGLGLPLVLVLRETPEGQLHRFDLAGGRAWDLVVIANPAGHWMPANAMLRARQWAAVGWIYRSSGARQGGHAARPAVLVATGGGGTLQTAGALYAAIDAVFCRARQHAPPFEVVQAIGPRATGFGQLAQADRIIDPGTALNVLFRDADLVISTAGYNSVLELAVTDTPTLLVPIPRSIDDQAGRARKWGPVLGAWHDEAAPLAAADWLVQQIAQPARRTPVDLGPSGEDRAAEAILRLG
jgi:predicted glycosyltransferase